MDRLGSLSTNERLLSILNLYLEEAELEEVWRVYNPEKKHYSWFKYFPQPSFSRLDMFFISSSLLSTVKECKYSQGLKTDHSFIECTLINIDEEPRGKGLWKFNAMHLEDPEYVFKIQIQYKG